MEQKYLPIGSVCTLKGQAKKVMVTGYYSVMFNGNLRLFDYKGCFYPEGLLNSEQEISFNHSDIKNVDFVGYKDEDQEKFMEIFNNLSNTENIVSSKSYSKLAFDENGVVVMAEPVSSETPEFEFDEDGVVVGVSNPFHQEYESKTDVSINNWDIINDEEEDSPEEELEKSALNQIQFDENGVVISEGNNYTPEEQYQFDENGVLVGDNSSVKPVENTSNYRFDENGVLISE